ncbi:MAG: DnaJ domain-containing protein [Nannocystaceae bacterium]
MASSSGAQAAELSRIGLPRLMFALLRQRFTGMVTLPQEQPHPARRTIWLRGGMPLFTDWQSPRDRLGQILVERKLITAARCGRALHERDPSERLGQVLVRKGWIDANDLGLALRLQCARKLVETFSLRKGRVRIIPHEDLSEVRRDLVAPVNVLELILAGVTAHYDEGRVFTEMGAAAQGPLRASSSLARYRAQFGFRASDDSALSALTQGSRLPVLLRLPEPSPTRVAQLLYTLWACQMLRVGSAALRGWGAPTGSQPSLAKKIEPEELSPEAHAATFMAELGELEARIAVGAHPFDLLGVPLTASREEIRSAWRKTGAKFHPDALARQGFAHLRDRATDVFACLSEAHRTLTNPRLRERITAEIAAGHNRQRGRRTTPPANS